MVKRRSLKRQLVKIRSLNRRSVKRRSLNRRSLKKRGGNKGITPEDLKQVIAKFTSQQNKIEEALKKNQKRLQPIIDLYEIVLENSHILLANDNFRHILFGKMTAIEKNKDIYGDDAGNKNVIHHFDEVNTELKKLVNQYNKIYDDLKIDLFQE